MKLSGACFTASRICSMASCACRSTQSAMPSITLTSDTWGANSTASRSCAIKSLALVRLQYAWIAEHALQLFRGFLAQHSGKSQMGGGAEGREIISRRQLERNRAAFSLWKLHRNRSIKLEKVVQQGHGR